MITRREMLRGSLALGGAALFAPHLFSAFTIPTNRWYTTELGWSIGPQIYSFHRFPFDEALKLTVACGANHVEIFPGQRISANTEGTVGPDLLTNRANLRRVKELLAENGCSVHAIGVCPADRRHFEFAAEFNAPVLTSNPDPGEIERVDRLTEEFRICVGIHNHPRPHRWYNPDIVVERLKDASPRIGACADTGHWFRSGLNPLECVKKLKGRLISFHLEDVRRRDDGSFDGDVVHGQGEVGIAEILKEFATHENHFDFKVPFSIEYEADWYNNQPKVAECVRFFDATAREIVRARW